MSVQSRKGEHVVRTHRPIKVVSRWLPRITLTRRGPSRMSGLDECPPSENANSGDIRPPVGDVRPCCWLLVPEYRHQLLRPSEMSIDELDPCDLNGSARDEPEKPVLAVERDECVDCEPERKTPTPPRWNGRRPPPAVSDLRWPLPSWILPDFVPRQTKKPAMMRHKLTPVTTVAITIFFVLLSSDVALGSSVSAWLLVNGSVDEYVETEKSLFIAATSCCSTPVWR